MPSYNHWTRERLEREIRRHNRLYFVEARPEISDVEFDRMVEALRRRFPESPVVDEVGSDLGGGRPPVRHRQAMLSLEKCYAIDALREWCEKLPGPFIASPKIDGVAVALRYDDAGHLVVAATRGNGQVGENVTANARMIPDIPATIVLHGVEVRGEVYLPLSIFRERYHSAFMSPRNLAAGALKQKDAAKTKEFGLRFFAYDLLGGDAATEQEKRTTLAKAGFSVVPSQLARLEEIEKVCAAFEAERAALDVETDGVVIRLDTVAGQERVGSTAHHPRYAIAYKYAGDAATTTIREIEWSVSRSQIITPIGLIEPVRLSGAIVGRVSLHNYGLAKQLGVGLGATVVVMRRGGVIPHLESVVTPGKAVLTPPQQCPSCGAATHVDGDFVSCTNPRGCGQAVIGALKHFLDAIDCEGFGPKLLQQLVDAELVSDPADLFTLTRDEILSLERMGETLADKLLQHLDERRRLPLDQFLRALGVPELARQTSRLLAGYGSLEAVLALTEEDLIAHHGIGSAIAAAVVHGLHDRKALIDKLRRHVTIMAPERAVREGPLVGKTFLFTGTLERMERNAAHQLVEAQGGRIASGISAKLDYLVVGEAGGAGSKLKKAQALIDEGAPLRILSEMEFFQMVEK